MTIMSPAARASTGIGARKDYHALNAQLNLFAPGRSIQFHKDKEAADEYLRQHVIPNTRTFPSVAERLEWLVANAYYERAFLDAYAPEFLTDLHERARGAGHRFQTFLGAFQVLHFLRPEDVRRHHVPGRF